MEKKHHYTLPEKREFLRIIKKYGSIIEMKACDGNTLRRKNIAWNRIACEYNTSSISPYPASTTQLRRLWLNLKQRNKHSIKKFDPESPLSDSRLANEDSVELADVVDEISNISMPHFVNVGESQNQAEERKTQIMLGNHQENDTFTETESEVPPFEFEIIDEMEEDVKPKAQSVTDKDETQRVRNNLLVREYQDNKRRLNDLHILQKRLLIERVREARAKANLAELELKQHQDLGA